MAEETGPVACGEDDGVGFIGFGGVDDGRGPALGCVTGGEGVEPLSSGAEFHGAAAAVVADGVVGGGSAVVASQGGFVFTGLAEDVGGHGVVQTAGVLRGGDGGEALLYEGARWAGPMKGYRVLVQQGVFLGCEAGDGEVGWIVGGGCVEGVGWRVIDDFLFRGQAGVGGGGVAEAFEEGRDVVAGVGGVHGAEA